MWYAVNFCGTGPHPWGELLELPANDQELNAPPKSLPILLDALRDDGMIFCTNRLFQPRHEWLVHPRITRAQYEGAAEHHSRKKPVSPYAFPALYATMEPRQRPRLRGRNQEEQP